MTKFVIYSYALDRMERVIISDKVFKMPKGLGTG